MSTTDTSLASEAASLGLTEVGLVMIRCLKKLGVSLENTEALMIMYRDRLSLQIQFLEWAVEHQNATPEEVWHVAYRTAADQSVSPAQWARRKYL